MVNSYKRNVTQTYWYKFLVLGFLFLALTLTTFAQEKKKASSTIKSRRAGDDRSAMALSTSTTEPQNFRDGEGVRRPKEGQQYFWDAVNGTWSLGYNFDYKYDANGRITEEVMTDQNDQNFVKYEYAYDDRGNETAYLYYNWGGNSWQLVNGSKTSFSYTNDKIKEVVTQYYENNAWGFDDREVYTYNEAGNLTEIVDYEWENNAWVAEEKEVFTYATGSNQPTTLTYQEWNGTAWENIERETNLTWNNFNNVDLTDWDTWQLASYTYQEWVNGTWENVDRETITYQANGSYISIDEDWVNGAWVNDGRTTAVYDDKGNETLYQDEEWKNGAWAMTYGYKSLYTYNSTGDMTEVISQMWEPTSEGASTGAYKNQQRIVFSNFQNVLSAKEELQLAAQVYPNPVQDRTFIKLDQSAGATVKVVSLAGRTMFSTELDKTTNAQEINLSDLSTGTYLLQIQTKAGIRTKKVVKL